MNIERKIRDAVGRCVSVMARYHDERTELSKALMASELECLASWATGGLGLPAGDLGEIIGPVEAELRARFGAEAGARLALEFAATFLLAAALPGPRQPMSGPDGPPRRPPRWTGLSFGPAPRFDAAQGTPMDPCIAPAGDAALKIALGSRLRMARLELFGEAGVPGLAGDLGLPGRTWAGYEAGVTIPGEVLLRFIELTGVSPPWLLRGSGPRYASPRQVAPEDGGA